MNCVFGEVKSLIVNGVSYDELFGVDVNLLNGKQRKEFVNEHQDYEEQQRFKSDILFPYGCKKVKEENITTKHQRFKSNIYGDIYDTTIIF